MRRAILILGLTGLVACEPLPAPTYEYGIQLNDLELNLITENVGVYPDTSVLLDPNNPFRDGIQGDGETRFQALDAGPIPGFYAFATANAIIPFGENQWYAANNLQTIYQRQLAPAEDLGLVRDLAIRGYQAVLDEFSDTAFTFDGTGRFQFDLLAPAVQGILDLGGEPQNGWTLTEGPDGNLIAVKSGGAE